MARFPEVGGGLSQTPQNERRLPSVHGGVCTEAAQPNLGEVARGTPHLPPRDDSRHVPPALPSKMLKLAPPKREQKPASQKRKLGFSSAAQEQQPKPQFGQQALGQKPGKEVAEAAAAAQATPDSAFVAWLKAGNGNRPSTQVARNYLIGGAPFLGTHDYERKQELRDIGVTWQKNPLKDEDCSDRNIKYGWYGAPNERILEALLELEPREEARRHDKGVKTVYAWAPRDCPTPQTGEAVCGLLIEHRVLTEERDRVERVQAKTRQVERERLLRERDQAAGRAADDSHEIARLRDQYGVEWSDEMGLASRIAPALGPTMGLTDVERVLRGLDLGVVEVEDVRAMRFSQSGKRRAGTSGATKGPAATAGSEPPLKNYNLEPPHAAVLLYGQRHPWMIKPIAASEWERQRVRHEEHDMSRSQRCYRATRCCDCDHVVMTQFGDMCACTEPREWVGCDRCGTIKCDGHQMCACDAGDEAWTTLQEAADRRHQAMLDSLEHMVDDDDEAVDGGLVVAGGKGGSNRDCESLIQ
tara:strand:- start:2469 stop:4052 length:1584 start_codon:yes stop_codon:yes gene_type:complete